MIRLLVLMVLLGISELLFARSSGPVNMSQGTGFFINQKGDIITANHVIENSSALFVRYKNRTYRAVIVASDPKNDLAILHIKVVNSYAFKLAEDIDIGTISYIIGFPVNKIGVALTNGNIDVVQGQYVNISNRNAFTTCGGNSGGPAVNYKGELVGVIAKCATDRKDRCGNDTRATRVDLVKDLAIKSHIPLIPSLNPSNSTNTILRMILKEEGAVEIMALDKNSLSKLLDKS